MRTSTLVSLFLVASAGASPPALPPVDVTCKSASDCAIDARYVQTRAKGGYTCCSSCNAVAVSTAWVAQVDRLCADHPDVDGECPAKKCKWPKGVTCAASRCMLANEPMPVQPKRFELVEGKPVDVGGGTTVVLKSVMYAHLSGSRNNSLLIMDVTHGAAHEQVTLDRLDPVGKEGPKYRVVMGQRMAIDYVDAYHQPSTGAILVLPE